MGGGSTGIPMPLRVKCIINKAINKNILKHLGPMQRKVLEMAVEHVQQFTSFEMKKAFDHFIHNYRF